MSSAKARNPGIELARIFGCLIVIGCHVYLPIVVDGSIDSSRALVGSVFADGVAIFWLILGFFLFQNKSYEKQLRHMAIRILLPMFLFSVFSFYVFPYVSGSADSLSASLHQPGSAYKEAFKSLLRWQPPVQGHLWYLYIYVLVILLFPALQGMVQTLARSRKLRVGALLLAALVFAVNVFTNNQMMQFSHYTIGGTVPAAMIAVFGHFLFTHKDRLEKYGFFAPLLFIAVNALRTILYRRGYHTILYWYSISGVVCASCVIAFSLRVVAAFRNDRFHRWISTIASYTFLVYLFHFYPIRILDRLNFNVQLLAALKGLPSYGVDLLYPVILAVLVFLMTLVIAVVVRALAMGLRYCIRQRSTS
ncbi:MAG: acyltransferase [Oscillospiraceae bacterium]|nr:acyltransferase [Oscillospiraceae bacterium]